MARRAPQLRGHAQRPRAAAAQPTRRGGIHPDAKTSAASCRARGCGRPRRRRGSSPTTRAGDAASDAGARCVAGARRAARAALERGGEGRRRRPTARSGGGGGAAGGARRGRPRRSVDLALVAHRRRVALDRRAGAARRARSRSWRRRAPVRSAPRAWPWGLREVGARAARRRSARAAPLDGALPGTATSRRARRGRPSTSAAARGGGVRRSAASARSRPWRAAARRGGARPRGLDAAVAPPTSGAAVRALHLAGDELRRSRPPPPPARCAPSAPAPRVSPPPRFELGKAERASAFRRVGGSSSSPPLEPQAGGAERAVAAAEAPRLLLARRRGVAVRPAPHAARAPSWRHAEDRWASAASRLTSAPRAIASPLARACAPDADPAAAIGPRSAAAPPSAAARRRRVARTPLRPDEGPRRRPPRPHGDPLADGPLTSHRGQRRRGARQLGRPS